MFTHSSLVTCVLWAACCLSALILVFLNVKEKITNITCTGKLFFSGSYCKSLSLSCILYRTQLAHWLVPMTLIAEDVRSLWVAHSHCVNPVRAVHVPVCYAVHTLNYSSYKKCHTFGKSSLMCLFQTSVYKYVKRFLAASSTLDCKRAHGIPVLTKKKLDKIGAGLETSARIS